MSVVRRTRPCGGFALSHTFSIDCGHYWPHYKHPMQTVLSHTIIKLSVIALACVLVLGAGIASAKSTPASAVRGCDNKGAPIINVTQKVINTVDSGEGGNYWAFDNLNRGIKVYDNGDDTFCAEVLYQGKFDSQEGEQSPGDTGLLTGSEDGTFNGGYQATIAGTLLDTPAWPTHGSVGTTDYQCDLDGNCPGAISWPDQYFETGSGFSYNWWGWTYNYKNCVWVNSQDGNSGDILCSASGGGPGDPL